MNWKATTAVTGMTTIAGWVMNSWLSTATPVTDVVPQRHPDGGLSDIVREAERLHRGVSDVSPFERPRRNPFRFGDRPTAAARPQPLLVAPLPAPVEPPLPPPISLVAIAVEPAGGAMQRTAVLNTPQGIVFAQEGETVGDYRVGVIDDDGVELVSVRDESVRRIAIK